MRMKALIGLMLLLLLCGITVNVNAAILTGNINGLTSGTAFLWGDGVNDLSENWSTTGWHSGYVYGSGFSAMGNNADVYVYSGLSDPTTITNASTFSYTAGSLKMEIGDTVFFKGTNGYYGAWVIDNIDNTIEFPDVNVGTRGILSGKWYFQENQTGNFSNSSSSPVPEPATMLLFGIGILGIAGVSRKKTS